MNTKSTGRLGLAATSVILALSIAASADAELLKIGESKTFGMEDPNQIGFINGLLNKKLGTTNMTSGGQITRIGQHKIRVCGFYDDIAKVNTDAKPTGYMIITAGTEASTQVFAPLTGAEQLKKGCWGGDKERDRENAEFRKLQDVIDAARK